MAPETLQRRVARLEPAVLRPFRQLYVHFQVALRRETTTHHLRGRRTDYGGCMCAGSTICVYLYYHLRRALSYESFLLSCR